MKIQYNQETIDFSDKFSQKVFTTPFTDIPDNTLIYCSSFYQENLPNSEIFRKDMRGVKFYNCNLDNCIVPEGNEIIGGSQRQIMVQNDLNDWEVDENNNPIKPVNSDILFEKIGLETPKPEDIPAQKVAEVVDLKNVNKK